MTGKDAILCTIFKGNREPEMYLYVARDAGQDAIPDELRQRMGVIREVMTLEITPAKKLARADAARVLSDIRDKGFYLQMPPEITGQVLFDGD